MVDQQKIEEAVRLLLEGIGEDPSREGLVETPARVARMYAELAAGMDQDGSEHLSKTFSVGSDDLVIERDITFYSLCEHHMLPFFGKVHIAYIPKGERIITIEDNAELQIQGVENLVRLEAKEANLESGTEITIRDLIRAALRMRPNRVIIGEVRGAETFELLSALNTGHAGSLSTAHANSVKDMISRLETMVLMGVQLPLEAIRRQIASGIEILVHLGRGEDGSRRVEEIAEITGMEEDEIKTVSLFRREYGRGLQKTGELVHREKLEGKTG